jgi:Arc/MetJ-type ribon-helix-helix transcriptional regulator
MDLTLRPETRRFIDDQIKAGRFASPDDLVEAAIADMRLGHETTLDDATIAAINEGEEQADRGEGIDFAVFRAQWKKRLGEA